jgi:hypothetical protein
VPYFFLVCERDKILPQKIQEMVAGKCNAAVKRCDAGHMVKISKSDIATELIVEVAGARS